MALQWNWKDKMGKLTIRQKGKKFNVNIYSGNALAVFVYEYTFGGKEMYSLYDFFADKKHVSKIISNRKKLIDDDVVKIELNLWYKSARLISTSTKPNRESNLPTNNQNIRIMNNVRFIPGYYEWHLVDEKDNVLLNIPDGIIDDCETKADLDFVIGDIPRQALRAVEEGEELYGCDVSKYVSDIDDDCVTKLMADTLSEYLGLTA